MRAIVRAAEALYGLLLMAGLVAPLVIFFYRVAPWHSDVGAFFAQKSVHSAVLNSLALALATALIATTLGFAFSWLLWRFDWPRGPARALALMLKIPYLLPPFFFAIGWIALAAPQVGYLNRALAFMHLPMLPLLYGLPGTIFVEVLWTTALAMIQLQGFFQQFPGHLEDAAVLCGASPARTFFSITVPLAKPQLISCALLTSVSALSAFGVPAMLASPAHQFVLTTLIYQGIKSYQDFSQAALLSLVLLTITFLVLLSQRFCGRAKPFLLVGGKAGRPAQLQPRAGAKFLFAVAALVAVLGSGLPCLAILARSLLRDPSDLTSWNVEKYVSVFTGTTGGFLALLNSISASGLAALVATLFGVVVAYGASKLGRRPSRILIEAWNIGYALPGTVIALALLVFFAGSITDTLWILSLAYLVKYAAFALRTLTPAIGAIGKELEEAAWMSGASPVKTFFKILLPLLQPALAAAVLLALVPMLSELTMSVLLVGAGTETLGSVIFKMQEYADPGSAAVLAVTAMAAILALNAILKRVSKGNFGI
ncbi:MAG: iron ABC transporter permease [Deltaproteobacteria bacterium]|nr:iron ABC transporter permease [Deltaproteobacteria bacterium]